MADPDPPIDSLGQAYAAATRALGFRDNRHEGKLTGLSAMGEPVFAEQIGQHFHVDEAGRIFSDFRNNAAIFRLLAEIAKEGRREDVAASIQKVLEDTMLLSVSAAARTSSSASSRPSRRGICQRPSQSGSRRTARS